MAIETFEYSHPDGWNDPVNFPTDPPSEEEARRLLQEQHKEVRDYIQDTLVPFINEMSGTIDGFQQSFDALTGPNMKFLQVRGVRNNG